MAIVNQWGKSAVDATRKNALPPYLDAAFGSFTKDDYLYAKTSSIDLTASTPSADQYDKALIIEDKNGIRFATIEGMRNTNDVLNTMVQCHRTVSGSTTYNQLFLGVDSNGVKIINLDKKAWNNALYPIGSTIVTSTNATPASNFGGTWSLIDKEFSGLHTSTSDLIIADTNNTKSVAYMIDRIGHNFDIRTTITPKVAIGETNIPIATIDTSSLGITAFEKDLYIYGQVDSGNGIVIGKVSAATSTIYSLNFIGNSSVLASNQAIVFNFPVLVRSQRMNDNACDKFHWRKTAN